MAEKIDLGWANGWTEEPEAVKKCKEANHTPVIVDKGRPLGRGLDNMVTCGICGYVYHYDSSD